MFNALVVSALLALPMQTGDGGSPDVGPATSAPTAPAPVAPAPVAPTISFTKEELARLARGSVVVRSEMFTKPDGKRAGAGKAYCIVNATPDASFAIFHDYEKTPEYQPRLKKVTVREKNGNLWRVTQELKIAIKTVRYSVDITFDPVARRMAWTLDKTQKNDIKDTMGSWEFTPWEDGKTLIVYTISLDTGSFVPAFIEQFLTQQDLPELLLSTKRRIESGGKWKKD